VVGRSRLDPHTLPDTTAGPVEDVRRVQSLLADRNDAVVAVGWVMHEDETGMLSALLIHSVRSDRIKVSLTARWCRW
jgi:hypothetical protein